MNWYKSNKYTKYTEFTKIIDRFFYIFEVKALKDSNKFHSKATINKRYFVVYVRFFYCYAYYSIKA
jgi:hypothetical protein